MSADQPIPHLAHLMPAQRRWLASIALTCCRQVDLFRQDTPGATAGLRDSLHQLRGLVPLTPALKMLAGEWPTLAPPTHPPEAVALWQVCLADLYDRAQEELRALRDAAATTPRKRRRSPPRKPVPLTPAQVEALQLVGENKGSISAAARAAGKSRQRMDRLYRAALAKLGRARAKPGRTGALPTDRRGQVDLADDTPDPTGLD